MLDNKRQILAALKQVATALGPLNDRVVFVGGAVVPLYVDNVAAPGVRPTLDIDIVFEIASELELEKVRKSLAEKQISAAMDQDVICRFKFKDMLIDVMATKAIGWAPANPWFRFGFNHAIPYQLDDVTIHLMPVAYFLASKFIAFHNKKKDPRTSHDFEDIIYILDNRETIVEEILSAESEVRDYLKNQLLRITRDRLLKEAVRGHLEPAVQEERFQMLLGKIKRLF